MAEDPRTIILDVLAGIAPEADLAAVSPQANLRRELDLDSVDFQKFLIGVAKRAGIDIPERDAAGLVTLAACEAYVRHNQ
jgi:acyl carrier protein